MSERGLESEPEWNGLSLDGLGWGIEPVQAYQAGGHHPVHLGDTLREGQYRVMHKLGHGGTSTVWLCRDLDFETPRYVAVKVLMADVLTSETSGLHLVETRLGNALAAKHICMPTERFWTNGPNGKHLCLVLPVLGPRVAITAQDEEGLERKLREIAFSTVQGMAALHSGGICHGDFRPGNVLLRMTGLDSLSEGQVIQALGKPYTIAVHDQSGKARTEEWAPKYLVEPVDFNIVDPKFITDEACIIDLGESFEASKPPEHDLGIPVIYQSPEVILDRKAGFGSDLWALACTLFAIRTGRKLFDSFDSDAGDVLFITVQILGPLPEPWWSTWDERKRLFKDEADEMGRAVWTDEIAPEESAAEPRDKGYESRVHPAFPEDPRSLRDVLAPGLWYNIDTPQESDTVHQEISDEEVGIFADLLGKLLRFRPEDRISAEAALEHEWFKM